MMKVPRVDSFCVARDFTISFPDAGDTKETDRFRFVALHGSGQGQTLFHLNKPLVSFHE